MPGMNTWFFSKLARAIHTFSFLCFLSILIMAKLIFTYPYLHSEPVREKAYSIYSTSRHISYFSKYLAPLLRCSGDITNEQDPIL